MTNEVEIHSIGSHDLKGMGRVHIIRTRDLPKGEVIRLGSIVLLKGERKRIRAVDIPSSRDPETMDYVGLFLEDV
jgi:hypothetical protein